MAEFPHGEGGQWKFRFTCAAFKVDIEMIISFTFTAALTCWFLFKPHLFRSCGIMLQILSANTTAFSSCVSPFFTPAQAPTYFPSLDICFTICPTGGGQTSAFCTLMQCLCLSPLTLASSALRIAGVHLCISLINLTHA